MDGFVSWSEQAINNLRAGVSKGVVLPKVVVERTLPQLEAFAKLEDPRDTVFWQPLLKFPAGPIGGRPQAAARRPTTRRSARRCCRRTVDCTITWRRNTCPSRGNPWRGRRCRAVTTGTRYLVRYHTTTDMTPDEVHELGLREVARLRANLVADAGRARHRGRCAHDHRHDACRPEVPVRRPARSCSRATRRCASA